MIRSAKLYGVLDEIAVRRASQHAASRENTDIIDCADGSIDIDRRLRELTVMLGSVAIGVQNLEEVDGPGAPLVREELRSDLIGLASIAVALAESLTQETT